MKPLKSPYYPQIGDHIVYLRQGHQAYLEAVETNDIYDVEESDAPWSSMDIKVIVVSKLCVCVFSHEKSLTSLILFAWEKIHHYLQLFIKLWVNLQNHLYKCRFMSKFGEKWEYTSAPKYAMYFAHSLFKKALSIGTTPFIIETL